MTNNGLLPGLIQDHSLELAKPPEDGEFGDLVITSSVDFMILVDVSQALPIVQFPYTPPYTQIRANQKI
jgi:hypothetical protein